MNRNQILLILGSVGIFLYGPLTPDAIAFARAVQSGDLSNLRSFADQYRHSRYSGKAIQLARQKSKCWPIPKVPHVDDCDGGGQQKGGTPKGGYQS